MKQAATLFFLIWGLLIGKIVFFTPQTPELPPEPAQPIVISFVGDMMFDRYIRTLAERQNSYDFLFEDIHPLLKKSSGVVGNLEGPITDNPSISQGTAIGSPRNYIFTFSPDIIPTLKKNNLVLVNLGNNHINNMGAQGITQTKEYLEANDLDYFGHYQDTHTNLRKTAFIHQGDYTIAFVNYNQFSLEAEGYTLQEITSLEANPAIDSIVVYTHWGNEYQPTAAQVTVDLAHQFADAGADLIIGSHPHVIQNSELYNDVPIFYSLGNFIFDQYFSSETRTGSIVTATFSPQEDTLKTTETKIWIELNGRIQRIETNQLDNK